eukprot:5570137-Alexandrium_andersonii.AAC.1
MHLFAVKVTVRLVRPSSCFAPLRALGVSYLMSVPAIVLPVAPALLKPEVRAETQGKRCGCAPFAAQQWSCIT